MERILRLTAAALYRQDPTVPIKYTYWKLNHLCLPFGETMNMYPQIKDSRQQFKRCHARNYNPSDAGHRIARDQGYLLVAVS